MFNVREASPQVWDEGLETAPPELPPSWVAHLADDLATLRSPFWNPLPRNALRDRNAFFAAASRAVHLRRKKEKNGL